MLNISLVQSSMNIKSVNGGFYVTCLNCTIKSLFSKQNQTKINHYKSMDWIKKNGAKMGI